MSWGCWICSSNGEPTRVQPKIDLGARDSRSFCSFHHLSTSSMPVRPVFFAAKAFVSAQPLPQDGRKAYSFPNESHSYCSHGRDQVHCISRM